MSQSKYKYKTNTNTNVISRFRRILIDLYAQRDVGGFAYVPALIRNLIDLISLSLFLSLSEPYMALA